MRTSAAVAVGAERHRDDTGRQGSPTHDDAELRPGPCEFGHDIAHGDGYADARPEATRGNLANELASGIDDLRMLAGGHAALQDEPHATAQRAFGQLAPDTDLARKPALAPAARADRPGEPGFNG